MISTQQISFIALSIVMIGSVSACNISFTPDEASQVNDLAEKVIEKTVVEVTDEKKQAEETQTASIEITGNEEGNPGRGDYELGEASEEVSEFIRQYEKEREGLPNKIEVFVDEVTRKTITPFWHNFGGSWVAKDIESGNYYCSNEVGEWMECVNDIVPSAETME